ncbi:MAG: DDE-type integrase/transposase/recombinase [Dehalococcoidales bacterium]|nr:DDE-type integrase/transposase/recombinase [Dehalococcoidales bacterium]
MSFIRAKEIPPGSGNWYDYEVETLHIGGKVIQKHIRYLGKSGSHSYLTGSSKVLTSKPIETQTPTTPLECKTRIPKMKTHASKIASAMGMYYGGMSLDAIQQQFKQDHDLDMSETNYWNWVKRFTKEAIKQCKDFHPEVGDVWIADETYMKLKGKNVYFWDIICPKTNYLLASHVSFSRSGRDARVLMRYATIRAGKKPKIVVTDKLKSYIVGVGDEFGTYTKHVQGGPFKTISSGESTAEIERFHKTLEQRTKVFDRYKDIESIKLLTQGWLINYNFFKQNEAIGNIPPAQCMSKTVPFKDWNDVVRNKKLRPATNYQVILHPRKPTKKQKDDFIIPTIDVTLKPINEPVKESA